MEVKGSVLVDYVRIVRKTRDEFPWDDHLKPEDWNIIHSQIWSTEMYPFECFQRIGLAVFKLAAKENIQTVKGFGKAMAEEFFNDEGARFITSADDPLGALERFVRFRNVIFGELFTMEITEKTENSLVWESESLLTPDKRVKQLTKDGAAPFTYQVLGYLEHLVESKGGRNINFKIMTAEWEGDPKTQIKISWE